MEFLLYPSLPLVFLEEVSLPSPGMLSIPLKSGHASATERGLGCHCSVRKPHVSAQGFSEQPSSLQSKQPSCGGCTDEGAWQSAPGLNWMCLGKFLGGFPHFVWRHWQTWDSWRLCARRAGWGFAQSASWRWKPACGWLGQVLVGHCSRTCLLLTHTFVLVASGTQFRDSVHITWGKVTSTAT